MAFVNRKTAQPLQGCELSSGIFSTQGFKANPGLELANAFSVIKKDLRPSLGVYSVLGNHDWWWDGQRVRDSLEANGIRVLDDEVMEVKARGSSVWLAGLADLWTRPQLIAQTIDKIPSGQPIIALTHNPEIFPQLPERVGLLLAGHTHGAQIRFPIIGPVVQPSKVGPTTFAGTSSKIIIISS